MRAEGFEPPFAGNRPAVLPLDDTRINEPHGERFAAGSRTPRRVDMSGRPHRKPAKLFSQSAYLGKVRVAGAAPATSPPRTERAAACATPGNS